MNRPNLRKLFCFGFGFTAAALADALRPEGVAIAATARDERKVDALRARGIDAHRFDGSAPLADWAAAVAEVDAVLVSTPPEDAGDPVLACHAADLAALAGRLKWLGYLSTTGVYGDRGGAWVDETADLRPSGPRGRRRVEAEEGWLTLWRRHGLPVHLFRLAGIYGPGRNQLETVRAGTAQRIVKAGQVFSRIHVEDIAQVLLASMMRPNPGAAYNVCDDEPAPPQVVVAHAAELLGLPPPPEVPFEAAELSPMARSFYAENKRVGNRRMHEELGVVLRYPTYREGLRALMTTLG